MPLGDPLWLRVSSVLLKDPTALPKALQIFAISLQGADSVLLSAGRAEHGDEAFTVQLEAAFPNPPSADTTCKQLQIQTKMLRLELAHENQQPEPCGSDWAVNIWIVPGRKFAGVWKLAGEGKNSCRRFSSPLQDRPTRP